MKPGKGAMSGEGKGKNKLKPCIIWFTWKEDKYCLYFRTGKEANRFIKSHGEPSTDGSKIIITALLNI